MQIQEKRIEYIDKNIVVYDVFDLIKKHRNFPYGANDVTKPDGSVAVRTKYYKVPNREIDKLYIHQTAGGISTTGFDAVVSTNRFIINDPSWNSKGQWTGRGRGWPKIPYTYYLPFKPIIYKGRVVIFRCNHNDWVTWHSSDNKSSEAIVCQGYFRFGKPPFYSFKPKKGIDGKPSAEQLFGIKSFVQYKLASKTTAIYEIRGHCDSPQPKPACPGYDLEQLYRGIYKDYIAKSDDSNPSKFPHFITLDTWERRQAALVVMGVNIGKFGELKNGVDGDYGYSTRLGVESLEDKFGLPQNGYWDPEFDWVLKMKLFSLGKTQKDIDKEIP